MNAVDDGVAELWLRAFDDIRYVAQANAVCAALRHDDFTKLRRRERLAFRLQHEPLRRRFHEARAAHAGRRAGRAGNILHGNPQREQAVGLDLNLQLPRLAAENFYRRHAGNGQ